MRGRALKPSSMAVAAVWVAFSAVDVTATTATGIAWTKWTPTRAACGPAHARLAHTASYEVTTGDLRKDDAALRATHSLTGSQHSLHCPFRATDFVVTVQPVLVIFATHFRMQGLFRDVCDQ